MPLWPTIFHGNDQVTKFFHLLDPLHGALTVAMQQFFPVGVRWENNGTSASPRSIHRLCLVMYTQRDARSACSRSSDMLCTTASMVPAAPNGPRTRKAERAAVERRTVTL